MRRKITYLLSKSSHTLSLTTISTMSIVMWKRLQSQKSHSRIPLSILKPLCISTIMRRSSLHKYSKTIISLLIRELNWMIVLSGISISISGLIRMVQTITTITIAIPNTSETKSCLRKLSIINQIREEVLRITNSKPCRLTRVRIRRPTVTTTMQAFSLSLLRLRVLISSTTLRI